MIIWFFYVLLIEIKLQNYEDQNLDSLPTIAHFGVDTDIAMAKGTPAISLL